MRIRILNPNTTPALTRQCLAGARATAQAGVELSATESAFGTPSVESHVDEALAGPGLIAQVLAGEHDGIDGYVLACFGDTGLDAARELARGPVVGMSEAALYAAALLAPRFSIITLPARTRAMAERVLQHAGLERRCRVRAIDLGVQDCVDEEQQVYAALLAEGQRAVREDEAEAIVLGCAGLAGLAIPLQTALGVAVIDGVAVAVKLVESLLALGFTTSKRGMWASPSTAGVSGPCADAFPLRRPR